MRLYIQHGAKLGFWIPKRMLSNWSGSRDQISINLKYLGAPILCIKLVKTWGSDSSGIKCFSYSISTRWQLIVEDQSSWNLLSLLPLGWRLSGDKWGGVKDWVTPQVKRLLLIKNRCSVHHVIMRSIMFFLNSKVIPVWTRPCLVILLSMRRKIIFINTSFPFRVKLSCGECSYRIVYAAFFANTGKSALQIQAQHNCARLVGHV